MGKLKDNVLSFLHIILLENKLFSQITSIVYVENRKSPKRLLELKAKLNKVRDPRLIYKFNPSL